MVRKPKNKGGRPKIYSKKIIVKIRVYLNSCKDEDIQKVKQENEEKGYVMYENKLKVNLPTIEGLAVFLHISRETIYAWSKDHKEFSDIIDELRQMQATALITNGLSGNYNSTIAKLILGKHGYRDAVEHSGNDGEPIKIDISKMLEKAYGEDPTEMHPGR